VARANGLAIAEGFALLALSFISRMLADAEVARQVCEQAGAWFWLAALQEAAVHLLEGRRDVSEGIFRRIRREARQGIPTLAAWVDAREACLYFHRGDLDEARKLLEGPSAASEASACGWIGAEWSAARGWLAWRRAASGKLARSWTAPGRRM
jgi:hypothetical protein